MMSLLYGSLATQTAFAQVENQVYLPDAPKGGSHDPYFVGELGGQWQFPSDHLPRGMSVGNLHIAFWNVLNKNYLSHILENTQGLRDSSIMSGNIPYRPSSNLTVREMIVSTMIKDMMNHPTHPRSLIGLQEVHPDVAEYLKEILPKNWAMSTPPGQPKSQDIYLYDKSIFELIGVRAIKYQENLPKTIFTLTLQERSSGEIFCFVQSHIPGGPNSEAGCKKFAEEALNQFQKNETTVLMGDMNASPSDIQKALEKAATNAELETLPFRYVAIDYPSHINTHLEASWIDNFYIYRKPKMRGWVVPSNDPLELHANVAAIVDLIRIFKIQN